MPVGYPFTYSECTLQKKPIVNPFSIIVKNSCEFICIFVSSFDLHNQNFTGYFKLVVAFMKFEQLNRYCIVLLLFKLQIREMCVSKISNYFAFTWYECWIYE